LPQLSVVAEAGYTVLLTRHWSTAWKLALEAALHPLVVVVQLVTSKFTMLHESLACSRRRARC
jgi:hypothetical protein